MSIKCIFLMFSCIFLKHDSVINYHNCKALFMWAFLQFKIKDLTFVYKWNLLLKGECNLLRKNWTFITFISAKSGENFGRLSVFGTFAVSGFAFQDQPQEHHHSYGVIKATHGLGLITFERSEWSTLFLGQMKATIAF